MRKTAASAAKAAAATTPASANVDEEQGVVHTHRPPAGTRQAPANKMHSCSVAGRVGGGARRRLAAQARRWTTDGYRPVIGPPEGNERRDPVSNLRTRFWPSKSKMRGSFNRF